MTYDFTIDEWVVMTKTQSYKEINSEQPLQIVDTQESMGVPHPVHSDKSEELSSGSSEPAESKLDRPKESPTVESCQGCRYVDFDGGVPYCCDTGFDLADMDECLKGRPLPLPADHNEEDDIYPSRGVRNDS